MKRAFTLIELMIVIAIIAIIGLTLGSAAKRGGCSAQKIFGLNQPSIQLHVPAPTASPTLLS